jgi:hypothetical protein
MNKQSSKDFSQAKNFEVEDIKEIETPSDEDETVDKAGYVDAWKRLSFKEKAKARPFITGIVMALWAVSIVAGLVTWMTSKDITLLVASPVLMTLPVRQIVIYYFKE